VFFKFTLVLFILIAHFKLVRSFLVLELKRAVIKLTQTLHKIYAYQRLDQTQPTGQLIEMLRMFFESQAIMRPIFILKPIQRVEFQLVKEIIQTASVLVVHKVLWLEFQRPIYRFDVVQLKCVGCLIEIGGHKGQVIAGQVVLFDSAVGDVLVIRVAVGVFAQVAEEELEKFLLFEA